jgi:acyl-CoA thioesterase I
MQDSQRARAVLVYFRNILNVEDCMCRNHHYEKYSIAWLTCLVLLVLCLAARAAETPMAQRETGGGLESKSILFFGDSLTAGFGIDPSQAFPALIQQKINAQGWKFRAINAGLSGETTAGGLRRIDWVLQRPIDVFVLELGANDGLRGLPTEDAQHNLQAIIDRVRQKYPRAKLVVVGMRVPTNMGKDYTYRFQEIFPELAKVNNAALLPFLLEQVAGKPELNLPDGIHPTPAGHQIVAENVWKVLEPVLQSLQP